MESNYQDTSCGLLNTAGRPLDLFLRLIDLIPDEASNFQLKGLTRSISRLDLKVGFFTIYRRNDIERKRQILNIMDQLLKLGIREVCRARITLSYSI